MLKNPIFRHPGLDPGSHIHRYNSRDCGSNPIGTNLSCFIIILWDTTLYSLEILTRFSGKEKPLTRNTRKARNTRKKSIRENIFLRLDVNCFRVKTPVVQIYTDYHKSRSMFSCVSCLDFKKWESITIVANNGLTWRLWGQTRNDGLSVVAAV